MRRILPFLLATSALSAIGNIDQRVSTLEDQMQDLRMQSVYGNYGANTAKGVPYLNSYGVYFQAEGIYWKFFEGGTDFVYAKGPNASASTFVDRLHYLDFDWRFAYRFTLGYQSNKYDLDVWSSFTRFTTDQSTGVNRPSGGGTLYVNQAVTQNADYTRATESMKIFYNVLDLNLGRTYFLRRTFSAHPFIGLKGAKINQRNYQSWQGSATSDFNYKSSNEFWGVGIQMGTRGSWHFTRQWSMFGSILGSLMYGWYDVDTTIQRYYPTAQTPLHLRSDLRAVVPNMAADAGFRWEYPAFRDRTLFSLSLAYEFQYWWAQNQMLHTKNGTTYSWDRFAEDFGLQGVKLNFGLDF
ncbi:MAG: hypothetical protein JSS32_08065 [Verrucomicrobia bacterium]|nr:hypothetical protein [Verrucomicrobiota bacterium]